MWRGAGEMQLGRLSVRARAGVGGGGWGGGGGQVAVRKRPTKAGEVDVVGVERLHLVQVSTPPPTQRDPRA